VNRTLSCNNRVENCIRSGVISGLSVIDVSPGLCPEDLLYVDLIECQL
jgi:hypothetical protein